MILPGRSNMILRDPGQLTVKLMGSAGAVIWERRIIIGAKCNDHIRAAE
jgi:hypothetical protein